LISPGSTHQPAGEGKEGGKRDGERKEKERQTKFNVLMQHLHCSGNHYFLKIVLYLIISG
jgi:hypothetical protein